MGGVLHLMVVGVVFLVTVGVWGILLVAAWRGMVAAESMAESLRKIANK